MDESTRDRMFEPFFTTKRSGRGLGMSAVYGIIKNHGGGIIIDSELGEGTAVSIFLPSVEPQRKKEKKPAAEVVQGWGTILVIDDEEMILNMSRVVLEKLGYRVIEARSGGEAVDLAKSFDGEIDLAILDYGLPDTPALKAYRLLKEARPRLKVILCSGYAIGEPIQEILDAGADDFIQKPFSIAGLSAKMRQILDK
jgi:CheY-like chemotaxis protein